MQHLDEVRIQFNFVHGNTPTYWNDVQPFDRNGIPAEQLELAKEMKRDASLILFNFIE